MVGENETYRESETMFIGVEDEEDTEGSLGCGGRLLR